MELLRILTTNNLQSFDDVKTFLQQPPYSLNIKEDTDLTSLYLLSYKKNISDLTNPIVKECRGIILEKETNKIVCYTFNKSIEHNCNINDQYVSVPDAIDYNTTVIQESIDGTQIRLYYYNNEWQVATTRCINAKYARWQSDKSFYELFLQCNSSLDYDTLDITKCYSFVIRHPENRIVVKYSIPSLCHVLTRSKEEPYYESNDYIGVNKPEIITFDSFNDILSTVENELSWNTEGFVLCDINYNRMKIKSKAYLDIKELRGNTNNLLYRYCELRNSDDINNYLYYYEEDISKFEFYESRIFTLASMIHKEYVNKHIKRLNNQITWQFRPTIYTLHGNYINTKVITTLNIVLDYINIFYL